MPILKKVPSYAKNVAKSVAYSAAEVVRTDMPTVSAFLSNDSNKEVGKMVYDNIKDLQSIRTLGRTTTMALRRSKIWEAGEFGIKNALDDIRTGKWYNKERIDAVESQIIEETMGGWDDMDIDMDSMEFGESDTPSKGDKLVSASVQVAAARSADQISETTIAAASAIMNQQKQSTELLYAQNFKLAGELRSTITNIGNKTNVYLDNIQNLNKTIAENNKKFFDVSTKLMQENNAMMKEMIEMQRNLYRNQQEIDKQRAKDKSKTKPGYSDFVSMEGVLDIKEYAKFVKGNSFKVLDEQTGGMLGMLFGGLDGSGKGSLLKSFAASPLSFVSTMMLSQMIPKNVKRSAGKLDNTIAGIFPTLFGNINKASRNSDNPLAQVIGKMLGIDTRVQSKLDTGKYEKGPMQFNGKANKSLTEVIPELLSDILSTLNGQPKRLYDFDKGKWTTGRAIKREFDQMSRSNVKNSFSDLMTEMRDYIGGGKGPKFSSRAEANRFEEKLESFLNVLYNNDGSFNPKKDYDMYQLAGISKSDYDMITKMIQNIGKRNHGVRMGISASVMSNKQALNNQMKALQDSGSIFSYLFNGLDTNKLYKTPNYEDQPVTLGSDLNKTLDDKGNNVFYYLQNMYDELYRMRTFGFGISGNSGWKNAPSPGKPFNENIYNVSRITNNSKPTAKERYTKGERHKDLRYEEMLEKHTKEGGKLYDLVDDKGNINLINATAEQKQIADMIEQSRVTGGFLHDLLYGDMSGLDKKNAASAKKDEKQIDAKKFLDRMKQSRTLEDKFKVLSDQAKRGTRGSANITANIISRADDAIYEFFFGDETGETDENNKTVKGFMNLMKNKLNSALDQGLGFIDDKVLGPLKKKAGTDSLRDWFLEKTGIKSLFDNVKGWLLGDEGQKNGFLHVLGEETKNIFSKAGGYVGNAFRTVFSPVTDKVKAGWNKLNQPSGTEQEIDLEEYLREVGSSASMSRESHDITPYDTLEGIVKRLNWYDPWAKSLARKLSANPYDIYTIDAINTHLKDMISKAPNNIPGLAKELNDLKKGISRYKTKNSKRINEYYNKHRVGNAQNRSMEDQRRIMGYVDQGLFDLDPNSQLIHDIMSSDSSDKAARYSTTSRLHDPRISPSSTTPRTIDDITKAAIDHEKMINDYATKILRGLNITDKKFIPPVALILSELSPTTTKASRGNIFKLSMRELHDRLMNLGSDNALMVAEKINSVIVNKRGNADILASQLLFDKNASRMSTGTGGITSGSPTNIVGTMTEVMSKLYDLINSIIDNASKAVRIVPTRIRTNSNALGGNTNARGSRRRESETEGRSSDSDDGGIVGAAYGATFNRSAISALSEGEIYGKDGLYGKVPKTGLYDVKAGTTVYPTKKNKAIEVAKEQDVINKAIYSNANAKGERTLQYKGRTYTEKSPGKWTAYWQDDRGRSFKDVKTYDQFDLSFRVKDTAKTGIRNVMDGIGYNGQIGSFTMPKNLDEAKALITKYAPKLGAGAILGGAIGLLAGNPILGAAIGGSASLVHASEQAKNFLFGDELHDEEGDTTGRAGGLISAGAQDIIKKYFPNMARYGTVGAGLGLLTPFGLVGGALIGSTIGWAASNDAIREALFGQSDDPKSGLMSQETRTKLKKAMPNMIIGAGLGVVTGPFGILGNALLGSGLGLVSTTEEFKNLILGTEYVNPDGTKSRSGGLMGSIRDHVVDPLKDFAFFFKDKMEDMFINGIINPIKESIKPLSKDFYLLAKNALSAFPAMMGAMFGSTFGRPFMELVDSKLISPLSNATSKVARGAVGLGTGIVSAPFRAVRGIARNRQMSHIRTGNADYMTAADRLQFRQDHKFRSRGGDNYQSTDEIMNLMNKDELKESLESMKVLQNVNKLKKDERAAGRALSSEVTKYFGTKGGTWRKFKAAMESNNIEQFSMLLDVTPMANGEMMSQAQKDSLITLANAKLEAVHTSRQKQNLSKKQEQILFRELREKGFNINTKNVDKISALLKNEYDLKNRAEKALTPEEEAANQITDTAKQNTKDIINALNKGASLIAEILANNAPDTKTREANRKYIKKYFDGSSTNEDGETTSTKEREERRQQELEEAKKRARGKVGRTVDAGRGLLDRALGRGRGLLDRANQYANDLDNPRTTSRQAFIDGTDIPVSIEEYEETNVPAGLARILGLGINKKNKAASKINSIYSKGRETFGSELSKIGKETKEVFDPAANAFRSFRRGMNGEWVENSGKAQTSADKAEEQAQNDQMNRLGLTIGGAIGKIFGTSDKETGEKKEGLLSKLFGAVKGPIGTIAKTLGTGLLGATVVAGVGHGSEFLFPKIDSLWNDSIKPWMNQTFDGLGDKLVSIKDSLVQLPSKFFNWLTGKSESGGLPALFRDEIFPWYLDGFGSFATTFLPPIVETTIKTVPAIVKGIGMGIMGGLRSIFFKDDQYHTDFDKIEVDSKIDSSAYNSTSNLSSISSKSGSKAWWKIASSTKAFDSLGDLDNIISGPTSGIQGKTKTQRKTDQSSYQAIINDPNASEHDKQVAIASAAANAAEYGPNGELLYNYKYMAKDSRGNTIDSLGNYTNDNSNALFDPFSGAASLQDRLFKGTARRILNPGGHLLPLKALSATGELLTKMPGRGIIGYTTRGVGRVARTAGNVGQAAFRTIDKGTSALINKVTKKGAATGSNVVAEAATSGLGGKVSKLIKEGFEGLFKSKPIQACISQASRSVGKVVSSEAIEKAGRTIAGKLAKKAVEQLKKAAATVVAKVSASVATANISTILFAVWDFGTGMNDARSILGLTDSQEVSWTERIIAGLLKCINGILTWGLIPESYIVDKFVEDIGPLIGINAEDLTARREAAAAELTAYNDAMGTNYDIEEFNKRNSLGTSVSRSLKAIIGKSDENTVAEFNAKNGTNLTLEEYEAQHTFGGKVKGVGSKVIKNIGDTLESFTENVGDSAIESVKTMLDNVKTGDIVGLSKAAIDWRSESGELNLGTALGSIISKVTYPVLAPVTLAVGGFKLIGKGIDAVIGGITSEGPAAMNKIKQSMNYMAEGDVGGLISSLFTQNTDAEGNLSIGKVIGSVLTAVSLPLTLIPTSVIGAGKTIISGISTVIGAVTNTADLTNKNAVAIRDLAQRGELKELFAYQVDKGENNPLGFLQSGLGLANKLIQAPVAAFHALGNGIDKLLGTGSENDNKIVKVSDVIDEMYTYMDVNKHPSMDGWSNIGSKYTKATGPIGIINNVIVSAVKGIGKYVVGIVRGLGGIISLIDKIPGVNIGGSSSSGTGKYGLGRVSQLDPTVANTPFNTPGDTKRQTIGNSGCGPAAAVNAVNYAYGAGSSELINASKYALNGGWKERDGGTKPGFFTSYLGSRGLKASHIGNSSVESSLASGSPVILMGKDATGGNTPYGPNPHYVVAKGLDGRGNILIDDPESFTPATAYPKGKVLGKTSTAIRASRYGRSKLTDMFNTAKDAFSNTLTGKTITNIANSKPVAAAANFISTNISKVVTNADKYRLCFACVGWLGKSYRKMMQESPSAASVVSEASRKYSILVNSKDLDSNVDTVLSKYFKCSPASVGTFAREIAVYVDISCKELKESASGLHSKLKGYANVCNKINIDDSEYETKTVGSICNAMGLMFDGESPTSTSSSSYNDTYSTSDYTSMTDTSLQQSESTSIFDKIKDSFVSMFNVTGKDGQTTNLLSLLGLTSSSSSSSSYSSSSTNTVAGGLSGAAINNFPYYDQSDPQWGQTPYGKSGTISSSGCGPTSMAMILKSFGNQLTPVETAAWSVKNGHRVVGSGTDWEFFRKIGQEYGINTKRIGENQSTMINSLKAGFPMISSMKPGDFTKGGHFIVLSGIDSSGNILVNDPSGSAGKARSAKTWSPATITSQSKQMWIFDKDGKGSIGNMALSNSASSIGLGNTSPSDIEGNKAVIWKFLKSKGYNDIAAAGIMGNIGQECGFNYALVQKGASNPGYGICQWTHSSRKSAFVAAVPDWQTNLPGQLNFMWNEINSGYRECLPASMNKCATVKDAVWKFHQVYEQSADIERTGGLVKRENYGSQVYSQFANTSYGLGKYGLGVTDGTISSGFNDPTRASHNGVDIAARRGTPVKSPTSGTVIRAEENAENGKMVVIRDDFGKLYTFTHLQSSNVRVGSRVATNTIIGSVGSTGNSSGDHLHYQMTDRNGQFVDPVANAMGRGTSSASRQQYRAIGGSNGIDYTSLINNIIQLLAIIGTNTEKINALVEAMGKMGVDTTGIDTTSNESKINAIKSSISNGLNRSQQAQTVTTEIESQRLEKMTNIMRTIAAQ